MSEVKFKVSVDPGDSTKKLEGLSDATNKAGNEAQELGTKGRQGAAGIDKMASSADSARTLVKDLAAQIAAGFTFKELVQAAAEMETVKVGLQAVSGSAQQADKDFEFVRQTATRVGADVVDVGKAFLGLAAATKGTAVEGEPTRKVFEAVATSMAKAGKSSAETQNALVALAQMAGKGVVSMEELRGQLGEALPGALQAAASGMGITTQDLIKLVEEGKIAAEDIFPALTKGLNTLYGTSTGAQTLSQEITNLKNQFIELANSLGEAGGLDALKVGAEVAQAALVLLDDTLIRTGKTIGTLAAAVATMDFSGITDAFAQIEAEGRAKLLKAAEHNDVLRKALMASSDAATQAALQQRESAKATQTAGEAAAAAAPSYVALGSAYSKVLESLKQNIESAEKATAARQAEGKAATDLANAFGTEIERRTAAADAAQQNAEALQKVSDLRQAEVAVMQTELEAKKAMLAQDGAMTEQRQKELDELTKKIGLRQEDADKAKAQAQSAALAADAARGEAEAYADNSGRVKELGRAYDEARAKVAELRAQQAQGKDVTDQLAAAQREAGRAAMAYRDALADTTEKIKATTAGKRADLEVDRSVYELRLQQVNGMAALARALGDETQERYYLIEAKRTEIELTKIKAEQLRIEAEGQIAVAEATKAELQAKGQLNDIKQIELDTSIKLARAKLNEAEAVKRSTDVMEGEITALRDNTNARERNAQSAGGTTSAIGRERDMREMNADAIQQENDRIAEQNNLRKMGSSYYDKNGWVTDERGNRQTQSIPYERYAYDTAKSQGLSEADALAITDRYWANGNPILDQGSWLDWFSQVNQAISKTVMDNARTNQGRTASEDLRKRFGFTPPTGGAGTSTSTGSSSAGSGSTPVIVNINGARTGTINVASPADAQALQNVLRQLAADAGRST